MTDQVFKFPLRYLPLNQFCALTGYTANAIRQKIHRGEWIEGMEYRKDPNGHIQIVLEGFDKWVERGQALSHTANASG